MRSKSIVIGLVFVNILTIIYSCYSKYQIEEYNRILERIEPIIEQTNNSNYFEIVNALNKDVIRNGIDKSKLDIFHDSIVRVYKELSIIEKINLKLNYADSLRKYILEISCCNQIKDEFVYREYDFQNPYRSFNDSVFFKYELGNNCEQTGSNFEIVGSSIQKECIIGSNSILFKINLKDHENEIKKLDNGKSEMLYNYFIYVKDNLNSEVDTIQRIKRLVFIRGL